MVNGKESTCNAGDPGLIPGSGRSPGEGNGNPLEYSCLENPMDGGALQTPVVAKSRTRLSDFTYLLMSAMKPFYFLIICVFTGVNTFEFLSRIFPLHSFLPNYLVQEA